MASAQLIIGRAAGGLLPEELDPNYPGVIGPSTNTIGGGNLGAVFNAAADVWEQIIGDQHSVTITYRWVDFGQYFPSQSSANAATLLVSTGGSPQRITSAEIWFNNNIPNVSGTPFYMDANPGENSDLASIFGYPIFEGAIDFGSGPVNRLRSYFISFPGVDGFTPDYMRIAMHEIGHALGMSSFLPRFQQFQQSGQVSISGQRPNAGSVFVLDSNSAHFPDPPGTDITELMAKGSLQHGGFRTFPTTKDILAVAEASQFIQLNLNYLPITPNALGDFDRDGDADAADIDTLYDNFSGDIFVFNLTGVDNVVDKADVDFLVQVVLATAYGDLDLDGDVDNADFNTLQANFGMTGAGWADGDIDGDDVVGLLDFNILKGNLGFGQ